MKLESVYSNMEKALLSNKKDTENLMIVVGAQSEKIDNLEAINEQLKKEITNYNELIAYSQRKAKNANIWCNVLIPLLPTALITAGAIDMYNGNDVRGKTLIEAGAISLVGLEVVYQGGHWIFKWW